MSNQSNKLLNFDIFAYIIILIRSRAWVRVPLCQCRYPGGMMLVDGLAALVSAHDEFPGTCPPLAVVTSC